MTKTFFEQKIKLFEDKRIIYSGNSILAIISKTGHWLIKLILDSGSEIIIGNAVLQIFWCELG